MKYEFWIFFRKKKMFLLWLKRYTILYINFILYDTLHDICFYEEKEGWIQSVVYKYKNGFWTVTVKSTYQQNLSTLTTLKKTFCKNKLCVYSFLELNSSWRNGILIKIINKYCNFKKR